MPLVSPLMPVPLSEMYCLAEFDCSKSISTDEVGDPSPTYNVCFVSMI